MPEHLDAALLHGWNHRLDHYVAGDSRSVPVTPFVAGLRLHQGNAGGADGRLEVLDNHLAGTAGDHAAAHILDIGFVGLAQIAGVTDHVHAVLNEPVGDRTAV